MRSRQLIAPILWPPPAGTPVRRTLPRPGGQRPFASVLAARTQPPRPIPAPARATPAPPAASAGAAIVEVARGQLGGAYVWGGERPGAFDCSGLVRWAVRQATGQTLPRVAADQARAGQPVDRADLRPGDLVFFQNTSQPGISHVGIYAGAGQFIHAASERQGIIVSRLDEPYWAAHYATARRVT